MSVHQYKNNPATTLSGSLTAGATSLSVASATGFPTQGKFTIIVDSEIMLVTGVSGTTWTVTRGHESTTAAAHNNNATVTQILTVDSFLNANHFDVRAFGATGDGTTDDATAINLATTAASNAGGGTVYFPPGTYQLGASITLPANTVLRGAGLSSKIVLDGADSAIISANSVSKVGVHDLWLVGGNNAARTNNRGVHLNSVTDAHVSGVRAQQCYDGISIFSSSGVIVEGCYIEDDVSAGSDAAIRMSDSDRCIIRDNYVDTPAAHGIGVGSLSTDTLIDGNHVWSAGNTGIVVSGHSTSGSGPGFTVVNNVIRDCAWGIIIENGALYVRCNGNFIFNSTNEGVLISDGTGDQPALITLADNVIRDSGGHGIFSSGSAYLNVEGNLVSVFDEDGIRCGGGAGVRIIGNTVTGGTDSGFDAIAVYSSLVMAVVSGNIVRSTAGEGIVIDAAFATVTGNTVENADNGGTLTTGGIRLSGNADRCTVTGNIVRGTGTNQDYGILIEAGALNNVVIGNVFNGNATAATSDAGTGTTLDHNVTA